MKYLVQHFIEDSIRQRGNATAVKQGATLYTYGQIDSLSSSFENYFAGVRSQHKLVGILSRVRVEAIVAMIGALRAGLPYVPLNTFAPISWLGNIIKSAGIKILLADRHFMSTAQALREYGVETIICLDAVASEAENGHAPATTPADGLEDEVLQFSQISQHSNWHDRMQHSVSLTDTTRNLATLADDIAYVLYTSGSTGTPKGILITHRNAWTFIDWMHQEFALTPADRIFNRAPLQFDLSVFDIFTTFAAGACLVLPDMNSNNNAHDVVSLMIDEGITMVYTTPSTFISWLSKGGLERGIPSLRQIMYAGEPFPVPYLRKVMDCLPQARVSNIYGPTETNIVTYYHIHDRIPDGMESIPIGKPVHDTEAYIVDENLQSMEKGEIGEILIRGGTVFGGYFGDPERTKEKLIQSPFHSYPTLVCRTGDLGRMLPNGDIEYHGRMDNMVKTRGYRVELGEVESAISSFPGIDELAVIAHPHERYGNSIHAFIACMRSAVSEPELRKDLASKLPAYMMPFEFIFMDSLPKTATGKVDRVTLSQLLRVEKR